MRAARLHARGPAARVAPRKGPGRKPRFIYELKGESSLSGLIAGAISASSKWWPQGDLAYRRGTAVRDLPPLRRLGGDNIGRQSGGIGETIHRKGIRAGTLFPCRLPKRLSRSPANRRLLGWPTHSPH